MNTNLLTYPRLRFGLALIMSAILSFLPTANTEAQCALACNGTTQISLDPDCTAEVTAIMILQDEGTSCPLGDFTVEIQDHYGNTIVFPLSADGFPIIDGSLIGQDVVAKVIDLVSGNSCWGDIIVEDKIGPAISECVDQVYACAEFGVFDGPVYLDCEGEVEPILLSEDIIPLNCDMDFVKEVVRIYTAVDQFGNEAEQCTITYNLERIDTSIIECPINYTKVGENFLSCDGKWTEGDCTVSGFCDEFDPSNWAFSINGAGGGTNGMVDVTNSPAGITLIAADDGTMGTNSNTDICLDMPCDGTLSFKWDAFMADHDGPGGGNLNNDEPAYVIDGVETLLAMGPDNSASGIEYIALTSGQNFCFRVRSMHRNYRTYLNVAQISLSGQLGLVLDTDVNGDGINDKEANGYWDDNGNGYPDPEEVGVPTYNCVPMWPNPDYYCNIGVFYSDMELPVPGCAKKIIRTWEVREWWCGEEIVKECVQVIEITDKEAPTFTCPDLEQCIGYTSISTNVHGYQMESPYGMVDCAAEYYPEIPEIEDNCGEEFRVDYTYPGGSIQWYDGTEPLILAMGLNEITVTVYDECYNSSECTYTLDVVDENAPTAICDQFTVASLTSTGEAKVYAETFDDGSHDDCKLKKFLVRRMDTENCECHVPFYEDMTYLGENNGHHYYASSYDLTWYHAYDMAKAMGGYLLKIDDAAENSWVRTAMASGLPYYFDLVDENCDDIYSHKSGYYPPYFNWLGGDPNPYGGRFGQVDADGNWLNVTGESLTGRYIMEVEDICTFSSAVIFCCEDIGEEQMVVFRAVDYYGNYNDCMVSVEVQDKLAPDITCPENITTECDEYWDPEHLGQLFGTATVVDNCDWTLDSTYTDELNQCNIGNLIRKFVATDDFGRQDSCKQYITFYNPHPFDEDDIDYPEDETVYECTDPETLGPEETGYPQYNDDPCDLVGANYEDDIFYFNNAQGEACFKILRHWTVIDWCQLDYDGDPLTWDSIQVIKVHNEIDPVLDETCDDELIVCTYDADCADGYIELTKTATDDCTLPENMSWSARVDLDCDGSFDNILETTHSDNGPVADVSGEYPIGSHCVIWTFTDKCGNVSTCIQPFTIQNCKLPTPYCLNGLAVDLMPIDENGDGTIDFGMVELWASDFDAGSYHPCADSVVVSFSSNPEEINFTFDCDHVEPDVLVEIWATVVNPDGTFATLPDGTLLQSYCETVIDVQDNMDACPPGEGGGEDGEEEEEEEEEEEGGEGGGAKYGISGSVFTEEQLDIIDVELSLTGADMIQMTDIDGDYAFPEMPEGNNYIIEPDKLDEYLNGVTTLDIVKIQRHILGIVNLDSPYKIIAADVNHDENVTALDLSEIRKLILTLTEAFPNNTAWRFVDESYAFLDPLNPLTESFNEDYDVVQLAEDMIVDFIGIKVGDVNSSVEINGLDDDSETRNRVQIIMEDVQLLEGNRYELPIYLEDIKEISGLQLAFNIPTNSLEILEIESGQIEIEESNYYVNDQGQLLLSWNVSDRLVVDKEAPLFSINVMSHANQDLAGQIELANTIVPEIYTGDLEIQTPYLELTDKGNESPYTFALYQNTPNPFDGTTEIKFTVAESSMVTFTITDITGKVVGQFNNNYVKGTHSLTVDNNMLSNAAGVLYYTMEAKDFSATKKMVMLK